jgi:hypothetical protein
MKTLSKPLKLMMLLTITASFVTNTYASDDCKPIIDAADRAIGEQKQLIDLKVREIESSDKIIAAQNVTIKDLEKKQNNIFASPVTYLLIGVLAGVWIKTR